MKNKETNVGMNNEDYCSYEQSVKLKELGFDWECNHWYHPLEPDKIIECQTYCNHNSFERPYSAPTLAQAQKWLREEKQMIVIPCVMYIEGIMKYDFYIADESIDLFQGSKGFDTYEQALSAGINKALELLKEQNNGNQD